MTQEEKFNSLFDAAVFRPKKEVVIGEITEKTLFKALNDYIKDMNKSISENEIGWKNWIEAFGKNKTFPQGMGKVY